MTPMKTSTPSSRTPGQETKYRRLVEDAAKKAVYLVLGKKEFDRGAFQRLLMRGNELCHSITETIVDRTLELSFFDQYVDEEVESMWTYPKEYNGPKPIEEQIKALATILAIDPAKAMVYVKALPELPAGAEGWFAIMTPPADPEKYCSAIQILHRKIAASHQFKNYCEGKIDTAYLKVHPCTAEKMRVIAEQQPGGILIIAAQLGLRHRGRSSRRAREMFTVNEYGLGSVAGCSIVLTHPERFVYYEELDMDLPGDEFNNPVAEAQFDHTPCLSYSDGKVNFGTGYVGDPLHYYGSASGFVPQ